MMKDLTIQPQTAAKENTCAARGGCLQGSMRIVMADGIEKPINEIKIGDAVYQAQQGTAVVSNIFSGSEQSLCVVTLACGSVLKLTAEHPVLSEKGFVRAEELTPGDTVQGKDALQTVASIHTEEYDGLVYNLALDSQSHLMVCEGVLVGDYFAR